MSETVGNGGGTAAGGVTEPLGGKQFVFPFGETLAAKKHDDVSVQFQYDYLDEQFDVRLPALVGDGARGATNSNAFVSSPVTGKAEIFSLDAIRYRPGHSGFADFTFQEDNEAGTGESGAKTIDGQSGFVIKLTAGVPSFGYINDGVEYGSNGAAGFDTTFNGDIPVEDIDFTKKNIFRITFGFLGVANPTLWIRLNSWKRVHTVFTEGVLEDVHVSTPVFPMFISAENGAYVKAGSWNGGVIGNGSNVGNRAFTFPNTKMVDGTAAEQAEMTLTGTDVGTVVLFRAKDLFKGKANNVKAQLLAYSFIVDVPAGNVVGEVQFQIVAINTLSGAATYADINTNSSVLEYDHTPGAGASVEVTDGFPIVNEVVSYSGANRGGNTGDVGVSAEDIGAVAYAGDIFGIIAKDLAGNNVTVRVFTTHEELF